MIFPKDTRSRQRHSLKISADSCEPPGYMFLRVLLWDAVPLGGEQRLQRVQWQAGGSEGRVGSSRLAHWGAHLSMPFTDNFAWPCTAAGQPLPPKTAALWSSTLGTYKRCPGRTGETREPEEYLRDLILQCHPPTYFREMTAVDLDILIRLEYTEDKAKVVQ